MDNELTMPVRLDRYMSNVLWSHHEKMVLIDAAVGFLGGIDLCLGGCRVCVCVRPSLLWDATGLT